MLLFAFISKTIPVINLVMIDALDVYIPSTKISKFAFILIMMLSLKLSFNINEKLVVYMNL